MVPILRVQQPPAGLLLMADNLPKFLTLTASIVSAYVRHNSVPSAELPALIGQVHTALTRVSSGHGEALANALRPAISIKKSIAPEGRQQTPDCSSWTDILARIGAISKGAE